MYYILNETHQVIAADERFLSYCNVAHIDELSTKIAKGDIGFKLESQETVTLMLENKEEVLSVDKIALSSLLGQLTLIRIASDMVNEDTDTLSSMLEDEHMDTIINDGDDTPQDDIISLDDSQKHMPSLDLPNDDELFDLVLDDDTPRQKEETSNETKSEATESLDLDDVAIDFGITDENDTTINLEKQEEEISEIFIDSVAISQEIGISNDDYKNFLNDFIDTALSLEKDLQSQNDAIRNDAINTLSQLSDVLRLPIIGDIISNIKDNDTQRDDIESLYSTLSRMTTDENTVIKNTLLDNDSTQMDEMTLELEEETAIDDKLELFDEPTLAPIIEENVPEKTTRKGKSFGTISLEGIKPKHFDFQLEEAANDLSLPIELIEEFVNDFIEQAHIETKKMLQAYEEGDLDSIQKIGHLLKGASSNLRINALSDTLYKIQFCEKSSDLETLIKDYWAHFLSFETQINAISH